MKRFVIVLLVLLMLPLTALGAEEEYEKQLESYDFSFFEDTLGNEVYSMLEELGINEFDYEKLYSLSLSDILRLLGTILKNSIKAPAEGIVTVLIFIILSSFFQSIKSDRSDMNEVYSTVSALVISALLVVKLSKCISLAGASIGIASNFIYAFVPVFGALVAASGGITASFSTNALLLALSQGLSFIQSNFFFPLINCFLAIGICSGIKAELNLHRLIDTFKRIITGALSVTSGIFISVLSLKTSVSARADMLGIRGARFVISSVVPVVGNAISEGLISIQSYSALIKSSVGIVGIIAVALVFAPSVILVAVWRGVITLSLLAADVFDDKSVRLTLKAFSDALLLINVVLVISMLTTVISIGILVAADTGGA